MIKRLAVALILAASAAISFAQHTGGGGGGVPGGPTGGGVSGVTGTTNQIKSSGGTSPQLSFDTGFASAYSVTASSGNLLAVESSTYAGTPTRVEIYPDATAKPDEGSASTAGTIAWAAAQLTSGGEIFVHEGAYTVGTTITFGVAGTHLVCADPIATTITAGNGLNADMFHVGYAGAQRQGMMVENCGFNGANGSNTSGSILHLRDTANAIIQNNYFQDAAINGVYLDASTSGMVQNQFVGNFFIECVQECLVITDADGGHPTDSVVDRNTIGGSVIGDGTKPWVTVNELGGLQFTNNHISGPGHTNAAAFTNTSQSQAVISHNIFETINQDCLQVNGTLFTISNNGFYLCGQSTSNTYFDLNMEGSSNDTITGNFFNGSSSSKNGIASSAAFYLNQISGNTFTAHTGAAIAMSNGFSGGNVIGPNQYNGNAGGTITSGATNQGVNSQPVTNPISYSVIPGQTNTDGISTTQLATGPTPTIATQGTPGAATWSYEIVPEDINGNPSVAGSAGSTTTGNATLTTGNYNVVTWVNVPGAYEYGVYRTAHGTSPTTTGLIGTVLATATLSGNGSYFFNDTGQSGNSATPPATNLTGSATLTGPLLIASGTSSTTGGLCFSGSTTSCLYNNGGNINANANSAWVFDVGGAGQFVMDGTVLRDNSTKTSWNHSTGIITSAGIIQAGTIFSVSGCGTATSLVGGGLAGKFVGASSTCSPVITTGITATNGYACQIQDETTSTAVFRQTAYSQTTVTFTGSGTIGATDTLVFSCEAF